MSNEEAVVRRPQLSDFKPQGAVYEGLMRSVRSGSFSHAVLISGPAGVGKRTLAALLAQAIACTGAEKPCGACPACLQLQAETYPDYYHVKPDERINPDADGAERKKKGIVVDDVRYIDRVCGEGSFERGGKIIQFDSVEKMNVQAQNALLKTLEEPKPGVHLMLLTERPEALLSTIVSRCRAIRLHPWPDDVVRRAVIAHGADAQKAAAAAAAAGGSIGQAIAIAADDTYWERQQSVMSDFLGIASRSQAIVISARWKDRRDEADDMLRDLDSMIRTMLMVRLGRMKAEECAHYPEPWPRVAAEAPLETFARLFDAVREARLMRLSNTNMQALTERLLLSIMEERSKW